MTTDDGHAKVKVIVRSRSEQQKIKVRKAAMLVIEVQARCNALLYITVSKKCNPLERIIISKNSNLCMNIQE